MKPNLRALLWSMLVGVMLIVPASTCAATWAKTYGGSAEDLDLSTIKTSDGGYLASGHTKSFGGSYAKAWLIKLDASGIPQWQKAWGGLKSDQITAAIQLASGDFILVGKTESYGAGLQDAFIMKLSSSGSFMWMKTFGGSQRDVATAVIQTDDSGFLIVGYTYSFSVAEADAYVIKVTSDGTVQWQKSYGGDKGDYAYSVIDAGDGYIFAGLTYTYGSNGDVWLVKIDDSGYPVWQRAYGGNNFDGMLGNSLIKTTDSGFALAGSTMNYGSVGTNCWVMKFGPTGLIQWQKQYGGQGDDDPFSLIATSDGGFAFFATTDSFGLGKRDFWLVTLTSAGVIDWQKVYGGIGDEDSCSLLQNADQNFLISGYTTSFGAGKADMLLASVDSSGLISGSCIPPAETTVQAADTSAFGRETTSSWATITTPPKSHTPNLENSGAVATPCEGGQTCQLACTAAPLSVTGEAPLTVDFTSTATAVNCTGTPTFNWDFGDGNTSTAQNPGHIYSAIGTYDWQLIVTVDNQTCIQIGRVTATGKVCKITCSATANPTSGLAPLTVAFTGDATATDCSTSTVTYSWSFGDGTPISTEKSPSHIYNGAGTFTWTLTASVDNTTCTRSGQITVSACSISCQAYGNPSSGLPPLTVNFTSSVELSGCTGTPIKQWNFGDGTSSNEDNPTHTYQTPGYYPWTFTATVEGLLCSRSGSVTVTSCSLTCDATAAPTSGTVPLSVNFDANATPVGCVDQPTYSWNFGDGQTSTEKSPVHVYSAAGGFNWSVTASADGQTCTKGGLITVTGPTCTITCSAQATPSSGVAPLAVSFTSSINTQNCTENPVFRWVFGDGETSSEQNPAHTYATHGAYNWSLTVTIGQANCTATGVVTVSKPPCELTCAATATPNSGVSPLDVAFAAEATTTNCIGAISYAWDFGDGQIGGGQNIAHTYSEAGTYDWSVTVQVEGKSCVKNGQVTVSAPCTLTCQADAAPSSGKTPLVVAFTSSAIVQGCTGNLASSWTFGDGGSSSEQNPSHTYRTAGTFNWTLTITIDGKSCSKSGSIVVQPGLPGDCDGDGSVNIGEVQKAINMFLGTTAPDCGVDCDNSGVVTIGEVQKVINAFLGLPSSC